MASWRKLWVKITESDDVDEMPNDSYRLTWSYLMLALDSEGRSQDSATLIRSKLYPKRADVTNEQVQAQLDWFAEHGLIVRYEVKGKRYFYQTHFIEHQGSNKLRREAESVLPAPIVVVESQITTELLTSNDEPENEQIKIKIRTDKKREDAPPEGGNPLPSSGDSVPTDDPVAQVFQSWSDINPRRQITPLDTDMLKDMIADHGAPEVVTAIAKANAQGKPYLAYVQGILKNNGQRGSPGKPSQAVQHVTNIGERYA